MPPRRRAYKKKPTGARRRPALRRRRQQLTNVNRSLQPVASRYICKMKYADTITTNATGDFQFNLNSVFDPNRTGVGHQPYGHDTMLSLYNRYRVIACGWRVNFIPTATGIPLTICSFPANEVITFLSGAEARENPRTRYVSQSPGAPSLTLSGKQYIPTLVGRTKAQYMADDRYQAQMGANPGELAILNLYTFNNGDAAASVTLQVVLEYTVEFFDVKHLSQS